MQGKEQKYDSLEKNLKDYINEIWCETLDFFVVITAFLFFMVVFAITIISFPFYVIGYLIELLLYSFSIKKTHPGEFIQPLFRSKG